MSEYDQWLRTGDVEDGLRLLRRLAGQVTRSRRRFRPPEEFGDWTDDAVDDLLSRLFESKGSALLIDALTKTDTRGGAERYLLRAIENFLKDQAKAATAAKLSNRLTTIFSADDRLVAVNPPPGWRLSGSPERWSASTHADLLLTALAVRGVSIDDELPTSGPTARAAREALTAVSLAVLEHARGIVRAATLADVLVARFNLGNAPTYPAVPLDTDHDQLGDLTDAYDDLDDRDAAAALQARLTDEQQLALVALADDAAGATHEDRALADQVRELVWLAVADDATANRVVADLLRLCRGRR